jgi:hypothetical protein
MAFDRKNTRKNLDEKQTTPFSDPEKLLKPKGYLRQTFASTGKIYQPRVTKINVNIPAQEQILKEKYKQVHSAEASTSKYEIKLETPEGIIPEVKFEIIQTTPISLIDTYTSENKESISISTIICTHLILSLPEVNVYVSKTPKDYFLYSDSSPIASPIYISGKSKRPSSSFLFPPHLCLPSSYDHLYELFSHHPEVFKISVDQSFEFFDNLLFSPRISSPRLSMVDVGGVEGGGAGGKETIVGVTSHTPRIYFS